MHGTEPHEGASMTRQRRRGLQAIAGVFSAALVAALAIPSTASAASGGTLLAWGDSRPGQLGDGKTATSNIPVKVKLPPGTKITSVRAGCAFFLALTSAGRV